MIKRRIKRHAPTVVIITCTVKAISVPAPAGDERTSTNYDARWGQNGWATAADEKRRHQMASALVERAGKMRENLALPQNMADNTKCYRKQQDSEDRAYSMVNANDEKHSSDNGHGKYSMTTNNWHEKYRMTPNGTNDKSKNGVGQKDAEAAANAEAEQLQVQLQQLLDTKSVENVHVALQKMRQREAQSLRDRAIDVFAKDYVPKKYAKNSAEYGRPPPGSLTEMRANKATRHIEREMVRLCEVINENGHRRRRGRNNAVEPNGGDRVVITFGHLFNIYQFISDKVVGILLRARKHGMVDFEGEMLFQRRDEAKLITLLISDQQIQQALKEFAK